MALETGRAQIKPIEEVRVSAYRPTAFKMPVFYGANPANNGRYIYPVAGHGLDIPSTPAANQPINETVVRGKLTPRVLGILTKFLRFGGALGAGYVIADEIFRQVSEIGESTDSEAIEEVIVTAPWINKNKRRKWQRLNLTFDPIRMEPAPAPDPEPAPDLDPQPEPPDVPEEEPANDPIYEPEEPDRPGAPVRPADPEPTPESPEYEYEFEHDVYVPIIADPSFDPPPPPPPPSVDYPWRGVAWDTGFRSGSHGRFDFDRFWWDERPYYEDVWEDSPYPNYRILPESGVVPVNPGDPWSPPPSAQPPSDMVQDNGGQYFDPIREGYPAPETAPDPVERPVSPPEWIGGVDPTPGAGLPSTPAIRPDRAPDVDFEMVVGALPTGEINFVIRQKPRAQKRLKPRRTSRHDKKSAHMGMYRAGLKVINQTYGRAEELTDWYDILFDNMYVGKTKASDDMAGFKEEVKANGLDNVRIDYEGMLADYAVNRATETAIAKLQQLKAEAFKEMDMLPRGF